MLKLWEGFKSNTKKKTTKKKALCVSYYSSCIYCIFMNILNSLVISEEMMECMN